MPPHRYAAAAAARADRRPASPLFPTVALAAMAALALSGCAGSLASSNAGWGVGRATAQAETERPVASPTASRGSRSESRDAARGRRSDDADAALEAHLRRAASDWFGTPYRLGGTSRSGIDCSAFVRRIFDDHLGLDLPRTTATQVERGVAVSKDELRAGDLVFFRRRGVRHVGVYLSNGDFAHASSSRGVMVSNLSDTYFRQTYWTSRRVIDDATRLAAGLPTAGAAPVVLARDTEPTTPRRPETLRAGGDERDATRLRPGTRPPQPRARNAW